MLQGELIYMPYRTSGFRNSLHHINPSPPQPIRSRTSNQL